MNIGHFGDEDDCVPGVMGHKASKYYRESEEALAECADKWQADKGRQKATPAPLERAYVYQAEDPDVIVSYSFIKRVSEKAILLAIHDGNGLYEKWVPKSVVTGINENQVKIKSWFHKRNW